jgi:TRAP-type C4-dicarboxylate transport system permease small subunit
MKQSYIRAMAGLHRVCIVISIVCLVVMTLIIPWGVFTRYVLGFGSRWPEPMAILLMVIFAFFSAAACYRDNLHIAVMALPDALSGNARTALGWAAEIGMVVTNLFMVIWGIELVKVTYHQVIAEFPLLSVGLTYLPIPVGGGITLLFVIERLWTGALFAPIDDATVGGATME